jgi:hypothetical protein
MCACCCSTPQCRKEPKEVVVVTQVNNMGNDRMLNLYQIATATKAINTAADVNSGTGGTGSGAAANSQSNATVNTLNDVTLDDRTRAALSVGAATAFIGGGCCVHLSAEFMPKDTTASGDSFVWITVTDSEGTILGWVKTFSAQSRYQIQENIITTNPGAKLIVFGSNCLVRVRWCEVFSC